jgi:hypothetical protein
MIDTVSNLDILSELEPRVGSLYKPLFANSATTFLQRFNSLSPNVANSTTMLKQAFEGSVPKDIWEAIQSPQSASEALNAIDTFSQVPEPVFRVFTGQNKALPEQDSWRLNMKLIHVDMQRQICSLIKSDSILYLHLKNIRFGKSSFVDLEQLLKANRNLRFLEIISDTIRNSHVRLIAKTCENLESLRLKSKQITSVHNTFKGKLKFGKLKMINLRKCTNLATIKLEAPELWRIFYQSNK